MSEMVRLPRPPVEYRDVQVYDVSEDTKVVSGGFLPCQEAWLPSGLVDIEGEKFVAISKLDRRLRTFAGTALTFNQYIDELLKARNSACEQILKTLANESEAVVPQNLGKLGVSVAKKRLSMQAPKTVSVTMPVNGDPSNTADIKVLFESDFKVSVAVLVDATVLSHVCLGIHHNGQGQRGKERTLDNRVKFNYKEVRFNYSRGSAYIEYLDADGSKHTHDKHISVDARDTPEDEQHAMDDAAEYLHSYYVANHHPPADDAPDL